MTIKGGLKSLDKIRAKATEKSSFDGESPFLTLKDGDAYVIRYLQELDASIADERRGTIAVVEEHTSPKDFKLRAVCTAEEDGRCWACEQTTLPEIGKKWKPRMRYYANVLVRTENDGKTALPAPKVKILAQGFGDKNTGKQILEMAAEYENLSGYDCKLSRKGSSMNDTSYNLLPKAAKELSEEDANVELKDLSKFIKYVPYEQQADFYMGVAVDTKDSSEDW